jgi:hypothetical protein
MIKAVDSVDMKETDGDAKKEKEQTINGGNAGKETSTEGKKEDPLKKIITPHDDLIFHPDVTDVLMFCLGIVFFFQSKMTEYLR